MDKLIEAIDGKKSTLGIIAIGLLMFAGDMGWMTLEQVSAWTKIAGTLLGVGLVHKGQKAIDAIGK